MDNPNRFAITAIGDAKGEGFIAASLERQGWQVLYRALAANELTQFLDTLDLQEATLFTSGDFASGSTHYLRNLKSTIKEIHHRVKNNLQTVSALLRLQSRRVEDPTASAALAEAVRRVASIALVHETLSNQSTEFVEFDSVLDQIVKNAISLAPRPIRYEKLGEFGSFDSKVATALSLVIAELIQNALEHGLANSGDLLQVSISKQASNYIVCVSDNGAGLPIDFNLEKSANLGLQIVNTLTQNELAGEIAVNREGALTTARLSFAVNQSV
jgi:two-component sensor histidine kinase